MNVLSGIGILDTMGDYCTSAGYCDEEGNIIESKVSARENTWPVFGLKRDDNNNDIVEPFDPALP